MAEVSRGVFRTSARPNRFHHNREVDRRAATRGGRGKYRVIEGREEVTRIATLHGVETFELFDENEIRDDSEE